MRIARWLLQRVAVAMVGVYAVVSVTFGLVAFFPVPGSPPPDPGSPRDYSTPVVERYVNWMVEFTTLDWGSHRGVPVFSVLADALALTATYALPAVLVAVPVGMLVGTHSALSDGRFVERLERYGSYLVFAVPTFFLGIFLLNLLAWELNWLHPFYDRERGLFTTYNLLRLSLPSVVVALGIVAVEVRHARTEVRKRLPEDHVKLLEAQGGGRWLLGRRLLRQSAPSLASQFVAESLAVLLPGVVAVELVFGVPGFGQLLLVTALERSRSLVLGVTVVTVVVGIGGSLVADLIGVVVDPRVGTDDG